MNTFHKYFNVWWVPIICYLIPFSIFLMGNILRSDMIINIFLILFSINILGNIISIITSEGIKKWYYSIFKLFISGVLFLYVSVVFSLSPPDYYGANKTIPKNIEIYQPLEKEPNRQELENFDLVLSSSFQPGIYNYFTDYKPIETGEFYIKAFEITSNDRLSAERVKVRSIVRVRNTKQKLYSGEFKIYEGDWGDKYGAKIELWFMPYNNNQDYKITERNYIIEGWMR